MQIICYDMDENQIYLLLASVNSIPGPVLVTLR